MKKLLTVILSAVLAFGSCISAFAADPVSPAPTKIATEHSASVPTQDPVSHSASVPTQDPAIHTASVPTEDPAIHSVSAPTPTPKEKRLKELRAKLADLNNRLEQAKKCLEKERYKGNAVVLYLSFLGFPNREAIYIVERILRLRVRLLRPEQFSEFMDSFFSVLKLTDEILKVEAEIRRLEGN